MRRPPGHRITGGHPKSGSVPGAARLIRLRSAALASSAHDGRCVSVNGCKTPNLRAYERPRRTLCRRERHIDVVAAQRGGRWSYLPDDCSPRSTAPPCSQLEVSLHGPEWLQSRLGCHDQLIKGGLSAASRRVCGRPDDWWSSARRWASLCPRREVPRRAAAHARTTVRVRLVARQTSNDGRQRMVESKSRQKVGHSQALRVLMASLVAQQRSGFARR